MFRPDVFDPAEPETFHVRLAAEELARAVQVWRDKGFKRSEREFEAPRRK